MDQSRRLPLFLTAFACALYIGALGLLSPLNNWDLIGYIAAALSNSGLTGTALHDATYAELRHAIPPDRFDLLTRNGAYAREVFHDPLALEQQLPFYRIRVLYVRLMLAFAHVTQGLAQASYLISAAAAAGLTLLSGTLLRRHTAHLPWLVTGAGLIVILYICSVPQLARFSTPDALFSFAALAALALFWRARSAALMLVVVLPLIRSDGIVLSALLLILLIVERDRAVRHYAALAVSAGLYVWVNAAHGNYGHAVLFNFTFIPGQRTGYPATLEIVRDAGAYMDVYLQQGVSMLTRWVPWILLAGGTGLTAERMRTGRNGPEGRLALVCIAYVLLHFLAFPLGAARHYGFALIWCCIYLAKLISKYCLKTIA